MKKILFAVLIGLCLAGAAQAEAEKSDTKKVEIAFWDSIKDSRDPAFFRAYLKKYPAGEFHEIARLYVEKYGRADAAGASSPSPSQGEVGSGEPHRIALFPWVLRKDASDTTSYLAGETLRLIGEYRCLELSHSYYKTSRKYGVTSLYGHPSMKKIRKEIWKNGKPRVDRIGQLGRGLGVDAVMVGEMTIDNPWSDKWLLGKINIFLVDVETGGVLNMRNGTTVTGAREVLSGLLEELFDRYSARFCES